MLLFAIWSNSIAKKIAVNRRKWFKRAIWLVLTLALWMAMPRWRTNCSDRIRLLYLNEDYETVHPPFWQYAANVIAPENELANFGFMGVSMSVINGHELGVGNGIIKQIEKHIHKGNLGNFFKPYFMGTSNPMSGIWAQAFNDRYHQNSKAVYLCKPMSYSEDYQYPLIVFCHGYLGNLRLYQGILKQFTDAIVLSIPTNGLSGIYTQANIAELFDKYIPMLEKMGFDIDHNQIHLIGLSKGVSAVNSAMASQYATKFRSLTAISGDLATPAKAPCKINLVCGGKDSTAKQIPSQCTSLKSLGVDADMYFEKREDHFMMVNKSSRIIDFLKQRMALTVNDAD